MNQTTWRHTKPWLSGAASPCRAQEGVPSTCILSFFFGKQSTCILLNASYSHTHTNMCIYTHIYIYIYLLSCDQVCTTFFFSVNSGWNPPIVNVSNLTWMPAQFKAGRMSVQFKAGRCEWRVSSAITGAKLDEKINVKSGYALWSQFLFFFHDDSLPKLIKRFG